MRFDCFSRAEDVLGDLELAWRTSDALFELLDDAWTARPIPHRHPFVFYLGHLPAFAWNQIGRGALGEAPVDAHFEDLFERGIDPEDEGAAARESRALWPDPALVTEYRDRVRDAVRRVFPRVDARDGGVLREGNRVVHLVLEHELMHHETLSYMIQELDHDRKRRPGGGPRPVRPARAPAQELVAVPGGRATLGADFESLAFGWDNELPRCELHVDGFRIQRLPVTNADFLGFVEAGGYDDPAHWGEEGRVWLRRADRSHPHRWSRPDGSWRVRTFFEDVPLEEVLAWPVLVSQIEAAAYARWTGARLPTEAELHRAAYGTPEGTERAFPWGDDAPRPEHGNFGMQRLDPAPVGESPAGASAFGVEELVGNGWEWTSTPFGPHPAFEPWIESYPGYSADFFGGGHNVVFGGAWATHPRLLRRSFRNWYQRWYPYAATTFRCVRP